MNTNTGELRKLLDLTEGERESGEWVPVSDRAAEVLLRGHEAEMEEQRVKLAAVREALEKQ
jgi:hypothetical protein